MTLNFQPSCFHRPSAGTTGVHHYVQVKWCRDQTQGFLDARKAPYQLGHSPSTAQILYFRYKMARCRWVCLSLFQPNREAVWAAGQWLTMPWRKNRTVISCLWAISVFMVCTMPLQPGYKTNSPLLPWVKLLSPPTHLHIGLYFSEARDISWARFTLGVPEVYHFHGRWGVGELWFLTS